MRSPLAERLTAQGLSGAPLKSPVEVAERLLAVQGQDPRGRTPGGSRPHGGPRRRRRRPRPDRGPLAADHLAQPRHPAPGSQRGLCAAAGADDATSADQQLPPPAPGGRFGCCRGARAEDDRARSRRGGAAGRQRAEGAARGRRRAERRPGFHPPDVPLRPAGDHRPRPDARQAARLRPRPRLARAAEAARPRRSPWRSWPAAIWSATVRPTTATWPAGPACPCAMPAPASVRSRRSWSSARTAWSTSPGAPPPRRCRRRACSAPSTRCCWAGPHARKSSARTRCW